MAEFYRTLFGRRDVRSEFTDKPLPAQVLARLLTAAHHAPSVGLSQPWNFILVESQQQRRAVFDAFSAANIEAAERFEGERRDHYRSLKLQGILDAPVNLFVTCDRERGGDVVLGRTHQRETDLYSTVCAVQNLWLAARAEGVGVGWVSIVRPEDLATIFDLPDEVVPVAYLCLGYVTHFRDNPELQEEGWEQRRPVTDLVFNEKWGAKDDDHPVFGAIAELAGWPRNTASENDEG